MFNVVLLIYIVETSYNRLYDVLEGLYDKSGTLIIEIDAD